MTNSTGTTTVLSSLPLSGRLLSAVLPISQQSEMANWPHYDTLTHLSWRLLWPVYLYVAYHLLRWVPAWIEWLSSPQKVLVPNGFVVPAVTSHARFLPVESKHAFRYNTLYLAVRLDTLEAHGLDTGHAFSWRGSHYEPEFVQDSELAQNRLVHPAGAEAGAGAAAGEKEVWKQSMRAAERVERRRKQEKRRKTGAYTWSLTHLAPRSYLRTHFAPDTRLSPSRTAWISGSILLKLAYELRERGFLTIGPQDIDSGVKHGWQNELGQVWTVTMPALAGITGINPLSVHYCFRPATSADQRGVFWLAVLEVHNTFSERHIYVLEAGKDEDSTDKRAEYDHQWTFPRSFHVSPFNDRGGFYRLFLKQPFRCGEGGEFLLGIRLLLLVEPSEGTNGAQGLVKKLMATLDSPGRGSQRRVMPLTAGTLYAALMRQPTDLLTPFARILWQAGKLHFKKRLDAFGRPDMVQAREAAADAAHADGYAGQGLPPPINHIQPHRAKSAQVSSGAEGLVYPAPSSAELVAKTQLEQLAKRRIAQLAQHGQEWRLCVVSTNPADPGLQVGEETAQKCLTLYTRSYGVYADLLLYTHPRLALLLGSVVGRRWGVSSIDDFDTFFAVDAARASARQTWAHSVRMRHQHWLIQQALKSGGHSSQEAATLLESFGIPCTHKGDTVSISSSHDSSESKRVLAGLTLGYMAARAEQTLFNLLGARYVKGTEPWLEFSRGLDYLAHKQASSDLKAAGSTPWDTRLGSVRSSH